MSIPPIRGTSESHGNYSSKNEPEGYSDYFKNLEATLRLELNKKLIEGMGLIHAEAAKTIFTSAGQGNTIKDTVLDQTISTMSSTQAQHLLNYLQNILPESGKVSDKVKDKIEELLRLLTEKNLSPLERVQNVENFIHSL